MNGYIRAYFAISLSFIVALCLSMLPMPNFMYWLRPCWVTLLLIYWVVRTPNKVGVFSGFAVGISLDLLRGSLIGSMGFTLSIVAYFTTLLRFRLRQTNFGVQLFIILALVGIEQIISLLIQLLFNEIIINFSYVIPTLVSVAVWPFLYIVLRAYQRNLKIA